MMALKLTLVHEYAERNKICTIIEAIVFISQWRPRNVFVV